VQGVSWFHSTTLYGDNTLECQVYIWHIFFLVQTRFMQHAREFFANIFVAWPFLSPAVAAASDAADSLASHSVWEYLYPIQFAGVTGTALWFSRCEGSTQKFWGTLVLMLCLDTFATWIYSMCIGMVLQIDILFGLVMFAIYFVTSYYAVGIHATCILKEFFKEEDNMNLWIRWGIFMVYSTVLSLRIGNPFPLADPFVYLFADLYMTDPAARDEVLELGSSFANGVLHVAQRVSKKQKEQNRKTTDQLNKLNSPVASSSATSVSSNKSTVVTGRNVQAIQAPAPITSFTQAMKDANVLNCLGKCNVLDAKAADAAAKEAEKQAAKKAADEKRAADAAAREAAREAERQRKELERQVNAAIRKAERDQREAIKKAERKAEAAEKDARQRAERLARAAARQRVADFSSNDSALPGTRKRARNF